MYLTAEGIHWSEQLWNGIKHIEHGFIKIENFIVMEANNIFIKYDQTIVLL